ncbi:hypothetical protein BJX64DRAFT_292923 [Aspergillus heterothallicus]
MGFVDRGDAMVVSSNVSFRGYCLLLSYGGIQRYRIPPPPLDFGLVEREADRLLSRNSAKICGVSFNIRRIRSHDEPRSAAFGGDPGFWVQGRDFHNDAREEGGGDEGGQNDGEGEQDGEDDDGSHERWRCSKETGCSMLLRKEELAAVTSLPGVLADGLFSEEDDNDIDPDYERHQLDTDRNDDQPLEYDSAAEPESSVSDRCESLDEDEVDNSQSNLTSADWTFQANPTPPLYDTEFIAISAPIPTLKSHEPTPYPEWQEHLHQQYYEHIAGPGCRNQEAYLAHNISTEEMRNCHTVQCILRKPRSWTPADDDMEFEKDGDYFLTGLADRMPTSNGDMEIGPARHGVGDGLRSQSAFYWEMTQEELDELGLPFHPTCFELFIQASKKILGKVDIDALGRIRDRTALQGKEFPMEHDEDVLAEQEQVWSHTAALEYLVANPVFVPGLPSILKKAISNDEHFSVQQSAFSQRPNALSSKSLRDPFLGLPAELIQIIVNHLASPDIAALRLSSRAFTHLPISLWYRLLVDEIPSLYEAWSTDPAPYYWATILAPDFICAKRARSRFLRNLEEPSAVIRADMPEIADQWIRDATKWEWPKDPDRAEMLKLSPCNLPYEKTNWYQLYRELVLNWEKLKGMRNRARIWEAVLQIVDAIREFREEGE